MTTPASQEVTDLLLAWSQGDDSALAKLLPLVYDELHRLAHHYMGGEHAGHILQTTALVNEAYLRLIDSSRVRWQNRAHFFAVSEEFDTVFAVAEEYALGDLLKHATATTALKLAYQERTEEALERAKQAIELLNSQGVKVQRTLTLQIWVDCYGRQAAAWKGLLPSRKHWRWPNAPESDTTKPKSSASKATCC